MDTAKKPTAFRIIIFVIVLAVVIFLMRLVLRATLASGKYDSFAQCLVSKNVKFYGAFWCPHCQDQEKSLQATRQKLESEGLYQECSTRDLKAQTPVCIEKKIIKYPTWIFADGTRVEEVS